MHEESLLNDFTPLSVFELECFDDGNVFLLDILWPLLRLYRWCITDISLDITIMAQWVTYGKPHYYYFWKLCRFIHHHLYHYNETLHMIPNHSCNISHIERNYLARICFSIFPRLTTKLSKQKHTWKESSIWRIDWWILLQQTAAAVVVVNCCVNYMLVYLFSGLVIFLRHTWYIFHP